MIAAGAFADGPNALGERPLDVASDDACRALLVHHNAVFAVVRDNPLALLHFVYEHCARGAPPEEILVAPELPLRAYHLDPSMLWAPAPARAAVVAWAKDAIVGQAVAMTLSLADLPDDCAGDILDFLEMSMTLTRRQELLHHSTTSIMSPEAHTWMREVIIAAVVVRSMSSIISSEK